MFSIASYLAKLRVAEYLNVGHNRKGYLVRLTVIVPD